MRLPGRAIGNAVYSVLQLLFLFVSVVVVAYGQITTGIYLAVLSIACAHMICGEEGGR
jgi:hypothetical protein